MIKRNTEKSIRITRITDTMYSVDDGIAIASCTDFKRALEVYNTFESYYTILGYRVIPVFESEVKLKKGGKG